MIAAGFASELTGWLDRVSGHPWFLVVVLVIAFLDSVVPIVPSETCVIIAGVAAGSGHYPIWAVIPVAAVGAAAGDNMAYQLGRVAGPWFEARAARKQKTRVRMEWTKRQIVERGGLLLVTARFVPGGRTLLTLSCGITRQPRGWFVRWVALAALLWGTYGALLGYIGGRTFQDNHTKAFLVAFGCAIGATALIEVVRWTRHRRTVTERVPERVIESPAGSSSAD
jgi:membrane protein DedA with SNARE-associated domain